MNKRVLLLVFLMIMNFINAFSQAENGQKDQMDKKYVLVGNEFSAENLLTPRQMQVRYNTLKEGDTAKLSFKARVDSVCQSKGCWMVLDLENGQEVMVKFKDYSFFVPKDIAGDIVIVHGKAFVSETSVEEQRHYAEDAGKSPAEVQKITTPERTLSFEADGVKIFK
jgi:hypothetical protein